jgi:ATP-dependent DNA ligase
VPDETVLDGELAALDEEGRPSFNLLQNYPSSKAALVFFIFDVLILRGRNVMTEPLSERRALLEKHVLPNLVEPIRCSPELKAGLPQLIASVKSAGLEGLVAKRRNSRYESGQRSGAWRKMRINRGQQFVIGGYTPSDLKRCADIRLLLRREASACRAHTQRIHAVVARAAVQKVAAARDQGMSFREPTRGEKWQVGCRADGGEDEGLSVGEAGPRRAIRIHGMDARQSPAALTVHCSAR